MTQQAAPRVAPADVHPRLLTCGVVAGPLFLAVWFAQATTRDGFDPTRHPLSLLSLGELGWMQIANFTVSGVLLLAFAVGLGQVLRSGRGHRAAPILVGLQGIGLVLAGVFTTDAGAGFPPGAPAGAPEMSWHGVLHEVGFGITEIAWLATCVVFALRFSALGRRRWALACVLAPAAVLVVLAVPHMASLSMRLVLATAIQFALLVALARHHTRA